MLNALDIHVTGIVQGVGFRPFVYRLAKRYLLSGWVLNAVDGVHIHVEGEEKLVDEFIMDMHNNPPAAASIKRIDMTEVPLEGFQSFEIRFSDADNVEETTLVSPDLATCNDCVAELFDPADRRYRYPFINCTNCGPRFTIIEGLPYDRARTSMASFTMCGPCAQEYADPANRRFHAQPDACFSCGPALCFTPLPSEEMTWAHSQEESDALIAHVVDLLAAGGIVAIKGLGGFHLVCDAANAATLATLRTRKRRQGKAFAVMVPTLEVAQEYCQVSEEEAALLCSPARPIVLLRKKPGVQFTEGLADKLPELGVMLPATPLQHLVLHDYTQATGRSMLVFTSGNIHDEPIQTDDQEACRVLAGIADALLGNNRAIYSRYDDSVVRVLDFGPLETAVQVIRRARGYAPLPLTGFVVTNEGAVSGQGGSLGDGARSGQDSMPANQDSTPAGKDGMPAGKDSAPANPSTSCEPSVYATGPEQKNTFCLLGNERAFVSQHIGDMENVATYDAWLATKSVYEHLFEITPTHIACDMHPEYLTSKWAAEQTLPVVQVQHHHAHIVSALAEHGLDGPALGFAFDGTGYGPDGAIWGGEVLLANRATYERFANFAYVPLPGGAAAISNPLRCAYGALWAFDLLDHPAAAGLIEALGSEAEVCERMIDAGINTPYTSSVGRLFDAASALMGLCTHALYEGEPAILLEAALDADAPVSNPDLPACAIDVVKNTATEQSTALDTSVVLLDAAPVFKALLDGMQAGVPVPILARMFHDAFVDAIVQMAQIGHAAFGINTVVLSGGVFMNRYLVEQAVPCLASAGFTVVMNSELPPNDGCISFGQAIIAQATLN